MQKIAAASCATEQIVPNKNRNNAKETSCSGDAGCRTCPYCRRNRHMWRAIVSRRKRRHRNKSRANSGHKLKFTHIQPLGFIERVLPSVQRLFNAARF